MLCAGELNLACQCVPKRVRTKILGTSGSTCLEIGHQVPVLGNCRQTFMYIFGSETNRHNLVVNLRHFSVLIENKGLGNPFIGQVLLMFSSYENFIDQQ